MMFDPQIRIDRTQRSGSTSVSYCEVDAELSLRAGIGCCCRRPADQRAGQHGGHLDMNETGWHVDLAAVEEMQRRYLRNIEATVSEFRP